MTHRRLARMQQPMFTLRLHSLSRTSHVYHLQVSPPVQPSTSPFKSEPTVHPHQLTARTMSLYIVSSTSPLLSTTMATPTRSAFEGLPTEILLATIKEVHFESIENLSITCKTIHYAAKETLQNHLAKKYRYSTVAVGYADKKRSGQATHVQVVHPLTALHELLLDKDARQYVKTLIVACLDKDVMVDYIDICPGEDEVGHEKSKEIKNAIEDQLFEATEVAFEILAPLDNARWYAWHKASEWKAEILKGDAKPAAGLLVTILPNIQNLQIIDAFHEGQSEFLITLQNLLRVISEDRKLPRWLNTFDKLTKLGLRGLRPHFPADTQVLDWFSTLPSLQKVKGSRVVGLCDDPDEPKPIIEEASKSKVTSIEFTESAIGALTFRTMLEKIEELHSFKYTFSASLVDAATWWPNGVLEAVQHWHTSSLVSLDLTGRADQCVYSNTPRLMHESVNVEEEGPFIDSLDLFKVLETIKLEAFMLYQKVEFPKKGARTDATRKIASGSGLKKLLREGRHSPVLTDPARLVDMLPASAKRVTLAGGLPKADAAIMLADLPKLKKERLPNLESIVFEGCDRIDDEEVLRLCQQTGVVVEIV